MCTHRGMGAKNYMDAWGLSPYFDVYVTADDGLPRKPAPDMVQRVLDKTGLPASDFMMMGDRELDILAAHAAGVKGCLFTNGKENIQTEAEYKIREFTEFIDLIKEER